MRSNGEEGAGYNGRYDRSAEQTAMSGMNGADEEEPAGGG